MRIEPTALAEVLEITPERRGDARGWWSETWSEDAWAAAGLPTTFVQDALSWSAPGVLRGLHLQVPRCQGKLVYVLAGEVFDVAVDVRAGSPTFGRWVGATLSAENGRQVWIPPGFAHGFLVTGGADALFAYKCSEPYDAQGQVSIRFDDPDIGIAWPDAPRAISDRDRDAPKLRDVPGGRLPR